MDEIVQNNVERKYIDPLTSWLNFNRRVLNEAESENLPILEKLNFLGIVDSNLDEFIRTKLDILPSLVKLVEKQTSELESIYIQLIGQLKSKYNISILGPDSLDGNNDIKNKLESIFKYELYPALQPLELSEELPLPYMDDNGCFIVTKLKKGDEDNHDNQIVYGIIRLPEPELIPIECGKKRDEKIFCLNIDIISTYVHYFYKGLKVIWSKVFKVFRKINSLKAEHNNEDYVSGIKLQLRKRKDAEVILIDYNDSIKIINSLVNPLKKRKRQFPYGLSFLKSIRDVIPHTDDMIYPKVRQRNLIDKSRSIFDVISEHDILVHFPYEDFKTSTIRFIEEASVDPKVRVIKQTLYRVSKDSKLIKALMNAAKNGKQVIVLLELKAKMDELHNVELTEMLRSSGCNIIYGPYEIKTHAKISLVIREEGRKLAKYCNISTGNFNESTSKIYEDLSYFCKDRNKFKVGKDLCEVFNYLGFGGNGILDGITELLVSPYNFRETIVKEIDKCIEYNKLHNDDKSKIFIKCNSFTDKDICDKLYDACDENVVIDCIIRGMCIIDPTTNQSDNKIRIRSVIGRYLEHSRIYRFIRGDEVIIYIGSADIMIRNLDHRVEVLVPIKQKRIIDELGIIIDEYLTSQEVETYTTDNGAVSINIPCNNSQIQNFFIEYYKNKESDLR